MKRRYTVTALALTTALVMTGCSWNDVKSKFVGDDLAVSGSAAADSYYDASECVTLGDYKGIEVDCTVTDEEVQQQIDNMLLQFSTVEEIKKGKCKEGQSVNVDYTGEVDGKEVDGQTAEDVMIQLGSSGQIDGFDEGIIGMKPGKKKELNLQFPDDYRDSSLAGKKITYTVKLNYIAGETKTPEFNDAFVKKNTSFKSTEECRENARTYLAEQKKSSAGQTALQQIVQNSTFNTIPESLKESCGKQYDANNRYYISMYYSGTDFDSALQSMGMTTEQYQMQVEAYGLDMAKMLLVVEAIAAKENISTESDDYKTYLDEAVSAASVSGTGLQEQIESIFGDSVTFDEYMKDGYLVEKVMALVEENAVIKE